MAFYICITETRYWKVGEVRTLRKRVFNRLPQAEKDCFKEYDSNAPVRTTIEQIQDNIENLKDD